ncbi:MAG: phytanoyl-CoA dioxygenase family protein, partial [Anaerolineae bacterium]
GNYDPPPADATDTDVLRQYLCIHFPHKMSAVMEKYLAHQTIVDVATQVIGPDVKAMQSMLFIKAAGKPGQAWHQDEEFIPTRDRSLMGGWIALDDANTENGGLWVIPGSHKHGVIWPHHVQNDPRFDCTIETWGFPYKDEDAVPVEVKAGAIVFFNGYLLHRSLPNFATSGYRRVLVNHYMSAQSLLPWHAPKDGEWTAISDYRDIVMIAGDDPYGWKGTENIAEPYLRPDGEGGCDNGARPKDSEPRSEVVGGIH